MKNFKAFFLAVFLLAIGNADAILITDLAGVTTSASSCYFGCGGARYDASNIIDDDFGSSGNTGYNSWNSGGYGGYVQIDFKDTYTLDRIELYGAGSYYNPYTLSGSLDGLSWFTIATGGYHVEAALSHTDTYLGVKYGAVYDVALGSLGSDVDARFLRYGVNAGTPHWGYLFELRTEGHVPVSSPPPPAAIPEPMTCWLLGIGLIILGLKARRRTA